MPDNVNTLFSVRERPWYGKGVVLHRPPNGIRDAMHQSGTDWSVDVKTLYVQNGNKDYHPVDNHRAVIRDDNNTVLGIVGTRFTPVQNIEAFQFLDTLLGKSVLFEAAGVLGNGERVWVLCKIPDYITVGGDVVDQFILFSNSHDGKSSVAVMVTPIKVLCQNTLSFAAKKAKNKYSFRHVGNPVDKLHQAKKVLDIAIDYGKQFKQIGDRLASEPMTDNELDLVIKKLYGPAETDRAVNNLETVQYLVHKLAHGETASNSEGTKWGGLNAICEYLDYYRPTRGDSDLFARINFESANPKQKVFDIITQMN